MCWWFSRYFKIFSLPFTYTVINFLFAFLKLQFWKCLLKPSSPSLGLVKMFSMQCWSLIGYMENAQEIKMFKHSKKYLSRDTVVVFLLVHSSWILDNWAGIFKQSMGARNRVGIGLCTGPPGYIGWWNSILGIIPWNQFLGSINV